MALRSQWCARTSNLRILWERMLRIVLQTDAEHLFSSGAKSSPFEPRSTRPKRGDQKRHKCFSCNDKTRQTYLEVSDGRLRDEEDRIQQICSKFFCSVTVHRNLIHSSLAATLPWSGPRGGQHELHTLQCNKRSQAAFGLKVHFFPENDCKGFF